MAKPGARPRGPEPGWRCSLCVCVLPGVAHMCARGQKTREDLEKHLASVDGEAGLFHVCEKDVVNFARLTRIP